MKKLFLTLNFIILLMLSTNIYAENKNIGIKTATLTGRIIDSEQNSLPGATLYLKETQQGVVSNNNGVFRLNNIKLGKYTLIVSYIGYKTIEESVNFPIAKTYTKNFTLKEGINLKEVNIQGIMREESRALNQQKNNTNISNIVSAEQIGQFPDNNIGDALKRISGISVQYDQGEARFGNIRGTSAEYSSVTINNSRIPSAEAGVRSVQLDLIPADMIQTIEVNKVVTPDMEADAIGGSINLVTRSNPFRQTWSVKAGSGYNFLANRPQINLSGLYGNRFSTGNNSNFGMIFSASYQDNQLGSDNIEADWEKMDDGSAYTSEFQIRTYYLQRVRQSYSLAFDYNFNANHKIELQGIYNRRKDWENRYRVQYKKIKKDTDNWTTEIRRETKGGTNKNKRLEDQQTTNISLKGEHNFGNFQFKWLGSYSKASEDRPNERYISFRNKKVEISPIWNNQRKPIITINNSNDADLGSSFSLKELTEEFKYTEDIDKNFKIDFKFPTIKHQKIKIGARYKGKSKNKKVTFYEYKPNNEDNFVSEALAQPYNATKSNFMAGDYKAGHFVNKQFLGELNLDNGFTKEENKEEEAGNYDASEDIYAGYFRVDQKFGKKLKMIFGVRLEHTSIAYSGYKLLVDDNKLEVIPEAKNSYNNWLPSIIAKYSLSDNTKLKMAWTNTISRPKYSNLIPNIEIKTDDNEIKIGNPSLMPTTSTNLDFMAEHYFKNVGIVSGGLFYKHLSNISNDITLLNKEYGGHTYEKYTQPINIGNANLFGIELAYKRKFDFLSGIFNNIGLYANYTYTKSKLKDIKIDNRENEDLEIAGTPKNNLNLSIFYEDNKFTVQIALQYADAFIDEWGATSFYDRYYDTQTHLDFSTNYNINKHINIYATVNNILNNPLRYYQGSKERTMQAEYYGVKANIGVKISF